jgi:hypothetical protein
MKPKKLNRTESKQKKPEKNTSQTGFCPKKLNRTETNQFKSLSVFLYKIQPNKK